MVLAGLYDCCIEKLVGLRIEEAPDQQNSNLKQIATKFNLILSSKRV